MRLKSVICVLLLFAGCQSKPTVPVAASPTTRPEPVSLLLHLPGIGGELRIDHALVRGLMHAKIAQKSEIFDWTGPNRGLEALGTINDNLKQSKILSEKITQFRQDNPDGRIIVTAHSGGTGIAIWSLERLPDDVQIDELIMLASALSPEFDLSKAFKHVKGHVYSFYSKYDLDVLGRGTTIFGTIDRVQTEAAGLRGFKTEKASDPVQYQKLTQIPYQNDWWHYGNDGGHIGTMNAAFAENIIAPLIK